MKQGSTLFLRIVIYSLGLAVLGICVIFVGVSVSGNGGMYLSILIIAEVAAIPFFYALY